MEWQIFSISSFSIIYIMLQYFSFCPFLADELWPGALGYLINAKNVIFPFFIH